MSTLSEHARKEIEYGKPLDPNIPVPGCGCELCTGRPDVYMPREVYNGDKLDVEFVRTVAIGTIAERLGISLKKHGREEVGLCPFHDDSRPSMYINATKNVYHCFACGAGGDSVDLYMGVTGCTFREAVNQIKYL